MSAKQSIVYWGLSRAHTVIKLTFVADVSLARYDPVWVILIIFVTPNGVSVQGISDRLLGYYTSPPTQHHAPHPHLPTPYPPPSPTSPPPTLRIKSTNVVCPSPRSRQCWYSIIMCKCKVYTPKKEVTYVGGLNKVRLDPFITYRGDWFRTASRFLLHCCSENCNL